MNKITPINRHDFSLHLSRQKWRESESNDFRTVSSTSRHIRRQ